MTIPKGQHSITPHLVVPDAAEAIAWYTRGLGAVEVERVTLPSGKVMSLHMEVAGSAVMLASEFPDHGIVSPSTIGGTPTVLQVYVDDVDGAWKRAIDTAGRQNGLRCTTRCGETAMVRSTTRSVTAGTWHATTATSPRTR